MEPSLPPLAVLPLPKEHDSLSVLMPKLSSYLYVVHVGRSVAEATGYEPNNVTAEARATKEMRPHERDYFEAWKERSPLKLPLVDWDAHQGHTPTSQRPLKKAVRRAEALNRIYCTERAKPSHYTYFVENHALWVPLVTAVARVIGAERDQKEKSMKVRAQRHDSHVVQNIVQTSRRIICGAGDCDSTIKARRMLELLEATVRSRQALRKSCLGKRKEREQDLMDTQQDSQFLRNVTRLSMTNNESSQVYDPFRSTPCP